MLYRSTNYTPVKQNNNNTYKLSIELTFFRGRYKEKKTFLWKKQHWLKMSLVCMQDLLV